MRLLKWLMVATLVFAPLPNVNAAGWLPLVGPGGGGGGCSDTNATAWAAAVVTAGGTVSGTQLTNVCNLIVAYKSHGVYSLMDEEWLLASENAFTAQVSIVSPYHSLSINGTLTFTANSGYTVFSTTNFINTNYLLGTGQSTQNSTAFGAYVRGGRTTVSNGISIGGSGTSFNYIAPLDSSNVIGAENNGLTFGSIANPAVAATGSIINSRISSTGIDIYRNSTTVGTITDTSTAQGTTRQFYGGATQPAAGGPPATNPLPSGDILSSLFVGGGLTATQALNKNADLCVYMTAVGATGC